MTIDWVAQAAAHRRSLEFGRAWRESDGYAALTAAFDPIDAADPEAVAGIAQQVLSAEGPMTALLDPLIARLAEDPWFEPPLRASRDSLRVGAGLFEHPAATFSASVIAAARLATLPPARSVAVSGRLAIVRYVRGGGARLRLWTVEPAGPDFSSAEAAPATLLGDVPLTDGMVLRIDGRARATQIIGATSDVVTVTAAIRAGASPFQREYAVPSGELLRIATNDDGAARTQMLLTFLRHARRADAAPWFDAATRDGAFFLRWAAMREWLALDVATALPRLRELGDDANAEVRAAAAKTLPIAEAACRC
ncbi:MAG: hypothetical protein V4459_08120 [Pseudomonadota bacterium]